MKNIAVFFGGQSVEHDISVITGVMTVNSLDKQKYIGVPIFVSQDGLWYTGKDLLDLDNYKNLNYKKLDRVSILNGENALYAVKGKRLKKITEIAVAINCLHGERGEDGSLAGLLNMCGIPLASPPQAPSAICIDKSLTKTVLGALKVKTLDGIAVDGTEDLEQIKNLLTYPVIVKPNRLGSSIGVSKVKIKEELFSAVTYALKFGQKALIEPCLENFIEINCAVYQTENGEINVSECERPIGRTQILSFDDKYESGKRVFPADIDKKLSDKIKKITEKIYRRLNFKGVIRIDFFILNGQVYVNEINTVPGSLAYYLFSDTLKGFTVMLNQLICVTEQDFAKDSSVQKTYNSGILKMSGGKGNKTLVKN